MFQFQDANQPLIVDGLPRYGHFDDALRHLGRDGFVLRNAFGEARNSLSRWIGNKDFQYLGGMSDTLIFGCALAHLRYLAVAFVYVYDVKTRQLWSRSWRSPLGLGFTLADNPRDGESRFHLPGLVDIRMVYRDHPREKTLLIRCKELNLEARLDERDFQPMSICTRTGYSGFTYACKVAGQPLYGFLNWQGREYDLGSIRAYGHHDYSCGYMRRETWWNWACFSGEIREGARQGQRVGLNVSAGVNETGYSENCFWLDGRLVPLHFTRFDFDPANPLEPWTVLADNETLRLTFHPMGMHREAIRAGLVTSHFRQIFGEFQGCMLVDGEEISLNGLTGFVEDQYIKW
ncbi:MAG TPA: DUF2804 domain-containing protein [Fluviicoccus sp.]|nr:DUF2804 domain-containing protein [Fluviicoccus sp.]